MDAKKYAYYFYYTDYLLSTQAKFGVIPWCVYVDYPILTSLQAFWLPYANITDDNYITIWMDGRRA